MTLLTTHSQRYDKWHNQWCRDIGSKVAKIVNPPEYTALFPDVPLLYVRFHEQEAWQWSAYISKGYDGGRAHIRDLAPRLRRVQHPNKVLETSNEPPCANGFQLTCLNAYWRGCIDEADAQGIKIAIGHIPEGNPAADAGLTGDKARASERWKLEQMAPAVKRAANAGHHLGWHAYWHPAVEGPTGRWHSLGRVAWTIEQFLDMGVSPSLQVVVSEFSIDGLILQKREGWQILSTPDDYRLGLLEAEVYARTIPQIKGLCLFTVGWENPWETYDHAEPFLRSLITPVQALGVGATVPTPMPTPVSPPTKFTAAWLTEARRHKLRYNPGAALKDAIEAAGQEVKSDEWQQDGATWQWGLDTRAQMWHMWSWTTGRGVEHEYSEPVTR